MFHTSCSMLRKKQQQAEFMIVLIAAAGSRLGFWEIGKDIVIPEISPAECTVNSAKKVFIRFIVTDHKGR